MLFRSHHHVMTCLRRRVADRRVTRLVRAFLKAGVLSEGALVRTKAGTPQGGVLSPLLANIMLSGIERRYARYVVHPNVTSLPPFDPLAELDDPG